MSVCVCVCVCVCVNLCVCLYTSVCVWNFSLLSDPIVSPVGSEKGGYGLSGGGMMLLGYPRPQNQFVWVCSHSYMLTQSVEVLLHQCKERPHPSSAGTWNLFKPGRRKGVEKKKKTGGHLGAQSAEGIITFHFTWWKPFGWTPRWREPPIRISKLQPVDEEEAEPLFTGSAFHHNKGTLLVSAD